jgi:hypothetical protein
MGIVHERQLSGVRVIDVLDDDVSGKSCGTVEYPLLTAINYALRNHKTRKILSEADHSGYLCGHVYTYHKNVSKLYSLSDYVNVSSFESPIWESGSLDDFCIGVCGSYSSTSSCATNKTFPSSLQFESSGFKEYDSDE